MPILHWVGVSASSLTVTVIVVVVGICLLAPRGRTWVIYNLTAGQAARGMGRVLDRMGVDWRHVDGRYVLGESGASVRIQSLPMLRNVSVRFEGPNDLARTFERCLGQVLTSPTVETPAMASALLLAAMALIMTPLALMSNQAVQIVRLLSDLVN